MVQLRETLPQKPFLTDCLLVGWGQSARLVFTVEQWFALCVLMLQGNDSFLMPYVKDGRARFARSKPRASGGTVKVEKRIQWAWDTICDRAKTPTSIGFYPRNDRGESRWAAYDVDAHDGDVERARSIAAKLFSLARENPQLLVVLASSGNGGWHLFLFTAEFRPCGQWTRLLRQIADMAGVQIAKGHVEIFPDDSGGVGYGIRAPGTWNPKTGHCGLIASENVTSSPLLLQAAQQLNCCSGKGITSLSVRETTREENSSFPNTEFLPLFRGEHGQWTKEFAITAPRQRHGQLEKLVGAAFWQCGREVAEENARLQYAEAEPRPASSLAEHLEEFAALWDGIERQWLATLTVAERAKYNELSTDAQRGAFRVVESWRRCEGNDPANFPINAEALGRRIGMTPQGAGKLRRRFCKLGILSKVTDYTPQKWSACFAWCAASEGKNFCAPMAHSFPHRNTPAQLENTNQRR